jgi:hypothetical protein
LIRYKKKQTNKQQMGRTLLTSYLTLVKVESQDKDKDRNLGKSHLKNALDIIATKWPERIP